MSDAHKVMTAERLPLDDYTKALIQAPVNPALIKKNQYDKFGDGDYISVETITRILNEVFGNVWSWEILDYHHISPGGGQNGGEYVVCHSRLSVPGVGVRDGIGQAKADKKDNSTMFSSAASFSLKSAAKRFGVAPNLFDKEGWQAGVDVFQQRPQAKTTPVPTPAPVPNPVQEQRPTPQEQVPEQPPADPGEFSPVDMVTPTEPPEKKIPQTAAEKGAELRDAYGINNKAGFVAFAQIWNPQITAFEQIGPDVMDQLHQYVENNPEEFEDFKGSEY